MSEFILGVDLKVTCADHGTHEGVTMKVVNDWVMYVTLDGQELKNECCVTNIDYAVFAAPMPAIIAAIETYRRQNQ